jgi:RNA polymerase sigma factor (sigma-70 family)
MSVLDEQLAAWKRWKAGEREAAGRLFFKWYDALIRKNAARASRISANLDFEDFAQICRISICTTLDKYDPAVGGALPYWIKQRMKWDCSLSVRTQNGAFSIKNSRYEKRLQLNFARDSSELEGRGYNWGEIRESLALKYKVDPMDLDALHAMRHGRVELEEQSSDDSPQGRHQLESDDPPAEQAMTHAQLPKLIQELFDEAGLKDRQRAIVLARFDNEENYGRSLEEIGQSWGLSRERTRRLLLDSMELLAVAVKKRGLQFEDLW